MQESNVDKQARTLGTITSLGFRSDETAIPTSVEVSLQIPGAKPQTFKYILLKEVKS